MRDPEQNISVLKKLLTYLDRETYGSSLNEYKLALGLLSNIKVFSENEVEINFLNDKVLNCKSKNRHDMYIEIHIKGNKVKKKISSKKEFINLLNLIY